MRNQDKIDIVAVSFIRCGIGGERVFKFKTPQNRNQARLLKERIEYKYSHKYRRGRAWVSGWCSYI